MLRPYTFRSAPTATEPMLSLRPAARPSAAVAVVPAPAPAPAPISPAAGSRPAAAVTTAWRTRGTPPTAPTTAAAAPLRSGPPGVTIAAPAAPATRAPPIGLARRGLRAVWPVAASAHPTTVSHRERHSITAVTLHRVALAHGRRVGAPPGDQRAVGDAEPRAYPARCGVGAEPVLEVHLHARAVAYAVDEQVARTVGERVPTAVVRPIPVPVEPVAVKAVGPGEDRIVAQERIVKERIVARAVQRRVAVAIRPAPAVAEIHRVLGILRVVVRPRRCDHVRDGVVVEVAIGRHALHHVDQRGFLVVARLARVEHAVVPMIAAHELVELERRAGPGGEHQPRALAVVHEERFAVAPAAHFDGLVAAREVVVRRIEREQHPHATLGVGAKHEQIPVVGQPHVDTGVVSYRDGSFPASGTNRLWPKRLLPYSPISRWVSGATRKSASAVPPTTLMRDAFFGLSSNTWYTLYSRESPSTIGKSCSLSRHVR